MPGRRIAKLNRALLNPITRRLFPHLKGFGVVHHVGRKSGRAYRTPVNVFPRPDGYVIALTYGAESEWVRNVLAAGGAELEHHGTRVRLTAPRVYHDPARTGIRLPDRAILRLLHRFDFMELQTVGAPSAE